MNQKLHPHLEQLERSATLAINERSVELEKMGQTIYRFGLGQSPFPVPESIVRALQENAFRKDYLPVEGLLELRKAVANFHQEENELKIKPEGIMVGPGSKELMFTLQLALEGSTLIPSPCWVSYAPQANILKRQNYYINTHFSNKWRLQPGELISAIKLSDNKINNIKEELTKNFSSKIKLNYKYDESLIGGLTLQIGSIMIDTSIKNKLQQIENRMIEA